MPPPWTTAPRWTCTSTTARGIGEEVDIGLLALCWTCYNEPRRIGQSATPTGPGRAASLPEPGRQVLHKGRARKVVPSKQNWVLAPGVH